MFVAGKKSGTIRFCYKSSTSANEVFVAGTFSQWKPLAMRKQKDGSFALTIAVPDGTCEYKFVVDGNWTTDPDNSCYVLNACGTANSVAQAA